MPEQIIEIPPNSEVVISVTINPCKCDKSVEVSTEPVISTSIEEIPSNPIAQPEPITVSEPIPVIEIPIELPIAPVVDNPSVPDVEPAVSSTVETPTPKVVPTTEPIQPTPEVQPEVKPTPVEIPTPEVLPIAPILVIDNPIPFQYLQAPKFTTVN